MDAWTHQLAGVRRVAIARHNGASSDSAERSAPLSRGLLRINLQGLKEIFGGHQYSGTYANQNLEYLPTQISADLEPAKPALALSAVEQHIFYQTGVNGPGLACISAKWAAKSPGFKSLKRC